MLGRAGAAGPRALAGARARERAAAGCRRRCAAGRWARGRALGARQAGAGAQQGAGRAAEHWARGRQALGARGLGAWAGLGQCTRCTRPIFDPF